MKKQFRCDVTPLKIGQTVKIARMSRIGLHGMEYKYFEARVVGLFENYAVVRRSGYIPFIESLRDLEKWQK